MNLEIQRSETTDRIVRYLMSLEKDSMVSYDELSRHVGVKVTPNASKLISARRILQRDHNAVWLCVRPGVGVRRLTDQEIAERQRKWFLPGARNKLRRGSHQADVVNVQSLNIDEQARFATDSIIREMALETLSRANRNRVERVARGSSNELPMFNAVEWMLTLSPRSRRSLG